MNAIGSKRREGEGDVISTVRNVHRVPGTYSWADDVDILVDIFSLASLSWESLIREEAKKEESDRAFIIHGVRPANHSSCPTNDTG